MARMDYSIPMEFFDRRPADYLAPWWGHHEEIAALLTFLKAEHGYALAGELISVVEKPWHWHQEYLEMRAAQKARKAS